MFERTIVNMSTISIIEEGNGVRKISKKLTYMKK